jgi:hypothetical protein
MRRLCPLEPGHAAVLAYCRVTLGLRGRRRLSQPPSFRNRIKPERKLRRPASISSSSPSARSSYVSPTSWATPSPERLWAAALAAQSSATRPTPSAGPTRAASPGCLISRGRLGPCRLRGRLPVPGGGALERQPIRAHRPPAPARGPHRGGLPQRQPVRLVGGAQCARAYLARRDA